MKKIRTIVLICVLAGSVLIGALANAEPPSGSGLKKCTITMLCSFTTQTVWYIYHCPWGELWVDTGIPCF